MIKLKRLIENNNIPNKVYHFTTAPGLVDIINSNKLNASMEKYVSFSLRMIMILDSLLCLLLICDFYRFLRGLRAHKPNFQSSPHVNL